MSETVVGCENIKMRLISSCKSLIKQIFGSIFRIKLGMNISHQFGLFYSSLIIFL